MSFVIWLLDRSNFNEAIASLHTRKSLSFHWHTILTECFFTWYLNGRSKNNYGSYSKYACNQRKIFVEHVR